MRKLLCKIFGHNIGCFCPLAGEEGKYTHYCMRCGIEVWPNCNPQNI